MRILGVSQEWDKLQRARWTTFRFPRRDKDWEVNESAQIVVKPRTKTRKYLGIAEIISKEPRNFMKHAVATILSVSEAEAQEDGFINLADMILWMHKQHGDRIFKESMNKLALEWRGRRLK